MHDRLHGVLCMQVDMQAHSVHFRSLKTPEPPADTIILACCWPVTQLPTVTPSVLLQPHSTTSMYCSLTINTREHLHMLFLPYCLLLACRSVDAFLLDLPRLGTANAQNWPSDLRAQLLTSAVRSGAAFWLL